MTPHKHFDAVLSADYRKPFALIVAIAALAALVIGGIDSIERFVDGRIDLRTMAHTSAVAEHEKRLGKIEHQLDEMKEILSDIRGDVKVLRERGEKKR